MDSDVIVENKNTLHHQSYIKRSILLRRSHFAIGSDSNEKTGGKNNSRITLTRRRGSLLLEDCIDQRDLLLFELFIRSKNCDLLSLETDFLI